MLAQLPIGGAGLCCYTCPQFAESFWQFADMLRWPVGPARPRQGLPSQQEYSAHLCFLCSQPVCGTHQGQQCRPQLAALLLLLLCTMSVMKLPSTVRCSKAASRLLTVVAKLCVVKFKANSKQRCCREWRVIYQWGLAGSGFWQREEERGMLLCSFNSSDLLWAERNAAGRDLCKDSEQVGEGQV